MICVQKYSLFYLCIVGYSCNSNALTVEDGVSIWEGVLVNGFVEDTESFINSWDFSIPEAGEGFFSLVASAAHSASNGSSKTTATSLLHKLFDLISVVVGAPKEEIEPSF